MRPLFLNIYELGLFQGTSAGLPGIPGIDLHAISLKYILFGFCSGGYILSDQESV
jgi:hypothetical protein